jgi:hypothetical protein
MAKTREPTLADILIAQIGGKLPPRSLYNTGKFKNYAHKIRMAEKFVFDEAASQRVGEVIRDVPELMVEQIQFARPPFDLCWIEYELDPIFKLLNPKGHNPIDQTRDKKIGILIEHNSIITSSLTHNGLTTVLPFKYHLNTEWTLEDQLRFCDQMKISRMQIDMWLWGAVYNKFMKEGKKDYMRVLRDSNMVEMMYEHDLTHEQAIRVMRSTVGDFKNHIAVLLMLNRPTLTVYARVANARGWIRHKPRPFMAYNSVRMALDPVPVIRKLSEGHGEGELRRRHRVRGHYCHNDAARKALLHHSCVHDWHPANNEWEAIKAEVGDEVEHWVCLSSCGGRRWWREQHERGSAGIGYVDHTQYKVEA